MSREKEVFLNEDIPASEVRCIGDNGEVYGIISKAQALQIAEREGVDLVLIAPDAKPPVCKVMNSCKFRWQQEV